jgi:hypothetical protein
MNDWLDDLLTGMPSEAAPAELVRSVETRLAATRRADALRRRAWHGLMAGASAAGVWLLVPQLQPAARAAPALSYAGIGAWLRGLAASPPSAVIDALGQAMDLESAAADMMAPDLAVGMVLLAIPALYIVMALLGGDARREARFG